MWSGARDDDPPDVRWVAEIVHAPVSRWQIVYSSEGRVTKRVHAGGRVLYLKTAPALESERDRLLWLSPANNAPEVLGLRTGTPDWLLTVGLAGTDLTSEEHLRQPAQLVQLLASALTTLHHLDPDTCPFGQPAPGLVVVHGDACLPNFLADDRHITGFLDLGALRIDRPDVDLAAAVWSLQYNLGPGWGASFLRAYGWPHSDEATVEDLRLAYENQDDS